MSTKGMSSRARLLSSTVAASAVLFSVTACASDNQAGRSALLVQRPEMSVDAREVVEATSVEELANKSPVIVRATVRGVAEGRTVGDAPDEIQFRTLTLSVTKTLAGSVLPGTLITVEEEGLSGGQSYSVNESRWANRGDRAVWFLVQKAEPQAAGAYRLINSAGRIFIGDDGRLSSNYLPDSEAGHSIALNTEVAGVSLTALESRVAATK